MVRDFPEAGHPHLMWGIIIGNILEELDLHKEKDTMPVNQEIINQLKSGNRGLRQIRNGMTFPRGIQNEYKAELRKLVTQWESLFREIVWPIIPSLLSEANSLKTDSERQDQGWSVKLMAFLDTLKNRTEEITLQFPFFVQSIAEKVSNWNITQWDKLVKKSVGSFRLPREAWLESQITSFGAGNLTLIKDMNSNLINQLGSTLQREIGRGSRIETIRKRVLGVGIPKGYFAKTRTRAELIARNEIENFNSILTKNRQKGLGVERYIWRTSRDERVRASHTLNEGKIFSWDKPDPITGHPGEDFNCRCTPEAILSDIVGEDFKPNIKSQKEGQAWKKKHLKDIREKKVPLPRTRKI